jgi:hypothetical protein
MSAPLLLLLLVVAQPAHPGMLPQPAPAPVVPDTAVADIVWPDAAVVWLVGVGPDSVMLGDPIWVEVAGATVPPDSLGLPVWLEAAPDLARPSEAADRQFLPLRVYRLAPFRLRLGDAVSEVVVVSGRNPDPGTVAPVRMPRLPGWAWRTLLALLAILLLAVWLGRRLLARRRGPLDYGRDRPLAGAAWPRAAGELEELLAALAGGAPPRDCLDGLRIVTRNYVRDRFLVPGRELTGPEIEAACVRLGHPRELARRFARLVTGLDRRRYDPAPVSEAWCRERVTELVTAIEAVRIEPLDAPAAAADAWARVRQQLEPVPAGGAA